MTSKTPAKTSPDRAPSVSKPPRMRPALRNAIDAIVWKGKTQREAASIAKMNEAALSRALARPPINAYVEHLKAQAAIDANTLKAQAKAIAIREGIRLLTEASSEAVRAKMVELFAGDPKQPLVAVQINNDAAGYHYPRPQDFASGVDDAQVIDNKDE